MEFKPPNKVRKLDFSRPTFNEPVIQLPPLKEESTNTRSRLPSSFADDEESLQDSKEYDSSLQKANENVSVYLRLRSSSDASLYKFDIDQHKVIIPQTSNPLNSSSTEKHFQFTSILDEHVDQIEIYDKTVRPILSEPFEITGATFAGYGVSNSGKTYTILGESSAGLVPRAITQLFTEYESQISEFPCVRILYDKVDVLSDEQVVHEIESVEDFISMSKKQFKGKSQAWNYDNIINEHNFPEREDAQKFNRIFIWVSLVEIYNEKITDLLSFQKGTARPLKVFSNAGNSYVHGATWLYVPNPQKAFEILNHGLSRVSYAATGINSRSSRSHTIFTINVIGETSPNEDFQLSSFKFCDLAGAERLKKTGNVGIHLKEAGGINTSLLVLGRCLEGVFHNQSKVNKKQIDMVPVRDSKLTLLIQSSLVGNEKFVMIVNLLPNAEFLEENLNVLKFGSIASQIVLKKPEIRKFHRPSMRYSYYNQDLASPANRSSINSSYQFDDESDIDDSYNLSSMSKEELHRALKTQKVEIDVMRNIIVNKEREIFENDEKYRKELVNMRDQVQQKLQSRKEESENLLKEYHQKKLESQQIKYERMLDEAYDEIDRLEREIKKLRPRLGETNDENAQPNEDEIFEIEDDDD